MLGMMSSSNPFLFPSSEWMDWLGFCNVERDEIFLPLLPWCCGNPGWMVGHFGTWRNVMTNEPRLAMSNMEVEELFGDFIIE